MPNNEQKPSDEQFNSEDEPSNNDKITIADIHYRRVDKSSAIKWLIQAFNLFKLNPMVWLLSVLIMSTILIILLVIPFAHLFSIISAPIFVAGLMFGCQQLSNQKNFEINHLFKGFELQLSSLLKIGVFYLAATFITSILSVKIASFLGYQIIQITPNDLTSEQFNLQAFIDSLIVPLSIMVLLMIPVMMAYWFSPALVILHKIPPIEAIKKSFNACLVNFDVFLIYIVCILITTVILRIAVAFVIAIVPVLSVLLILLFNLFIMSILFASIYTSFEDIFLADSNNANNKDNVIVA